MHPHWCGNKPQGACCQLLINLICGGQKTQYDNTSAARTITMKNARNVAQRGRAAIALVGPNSVRPSRGRALLGPTPRAKMFAKITSIHGIALQTCFVGPRRSILVEIW